MNTILKYCQEAYPYYSLDEEQLLVLDLMDGLKKSFIKRNQYPWLKYFQSKISSGLYLWGGVGVGKTMLMDCFYESLAITKKQRFHFHHFMIYIHQELKNQQGKKNPLEIIAKELKKHVEVLFLDEFMVNDIADAMILARLLSSLFKQGICLITTSNVSPDLLYLKGLQRQLFLPAIDLLKKVLTVFHLTTRQDYRRLNFDSFLHFDSVFTKKEFQEFFDLLTMGADILISPFDLEDRLLPVMKKTSRIIWLDFKILCQKAYSQWDYLKLVNHYSVIFLSDVPKLEPYQEDTVSRFISLIDVCYDHKVKLVMTANCEVNAIYEKGRQRFAFERTISRLLDFYQIAYHDYLALKLNQQ